MIRKIVYLTKQETATRPWSWHLKDDESRSGHIPVSDEFIARMEGRRKRHAAVPIGTANGG